MIHGTETEYSRNFHGSKLTSIEIFMEINLLHRSWWKLSIEVDGSFHGSRWKLTWKRTQEPNGVEIFVYQVTQKSLSGAKEQEQHTRGGSRVTSSDNHNTNTRVSDQE